MLRRARAARADVFENLRELVAKEDRQGRRGSLVRAEPMIVAGVRHRCPQQVGIQMHRADHRGTKRQELHIAVRRVAGFQEVRRPRARDQFRCLPDPLMPANGFSCRRQVIPYFSATR